MQEESAHVKCREEETQLYHEVTGSSNSMGGLSHREQTARMGGHWWSLAFEGHTLFLALLFSLFLVSSNFPPSRPSGMFVW